MSWLVVGGAGYIGSHVVRSLGRAGEKVFILDNLSSGYKSRIEPGVDFFAGDARDSELVREIILQNQIDGVIHLAAYKQARESLNDPLKYWENNIESCLGVLTGIRNTTVKQFVLSSSCSVYGSAGFVTDESARNPISPYGRTKSSSEDMVRDCCNSFGINWGILRYFNVIGCDNFDFAHDDSLECVVPAMTRKIESKQDIEIYGNSFNTPDGTALRDYVDVRDLADAHTCIALKMKMGTGNYVINISTGIPISVLQIANSLLEVSCSDSRVIFTDSQVSDPDRIWGNPSQILLELGWRANFSLSESIQSHWDSTKRSRRR